MRNLILCFVLGVGLNGGMLAQTANSDLMGWHPTATQNGETNYVARPEPATTLYILPEEIEPGSIRIDQFSTHSAKPVTNNFVVRFTYTEAGARRLLAFQREHAGHQVVIRIGGVEWRTTMATGAKQPAGWIDEGWLQRRTAKFLGLSEEEARKLATGLKQR
jgi:hypothetical protein